MRQDVLVIISETHILDPEPYPQPRIRFHYHHLNKPAFKWLYNLIFLEGIDTNRPLYCEHGNRKKPILYVLFGLVFIA